MKGQCPSVQPFSTSTFLLQEGIQDKNVKESNVCNGEQNVVSRVKYGHLIPKYILHFVASLNSISNSRLRLAPFFLLYC